MFDRLMVQRYFFPDPSIVMAVDGVKNLDNRPFVTYLVLQVLLGGRISPADRNLAWPGVKTIMEDIQMLKAAMEQAFRIVDTICLIIVFS